MKDISSILKEYERVFIFSNTKNEKIIDNLFINENDLIIIFNNGLSCIEKFKNKKILWLHRFDSGKNKYFGEDFTKYKLFMHGSISDEPCTAPNWSCIHLTSNSMPGIEKYPIGKKLFNLKKRKKERYIISPTTGFITLSYIIDALKTCSTTAYAIDFGRLPNGWHGHDWSFERNYLSSQNKIILLNNKLKKDFLIHLRKFYPNSFF